MEYPALVAVVAESVTHKDVDQFTTAGSKDRLLRAVSDLH